MTELPDKSAETVEPGMAILEEFPQLLSVEAVIVPGTVLPPSTNLNFVAVFCSFRR